jgi:hypothetical protein
VITDVYSETLHPPAYLSSFHERDTLVYDAAGRKIKQTRYQRDGKIAFTVETVYDSSGYTVTTRQFQEYVSNVARHDSKGRMVSHHAYGQNGNLAASQTYSYDSFGDFTGMQSFNSAGRLESDLQVVYSDFDGQQNRGRMVKKGGWGGEGMGGEGVAHYQQ